MIAALPLIASEKSGLAITHQTGESAFETVGREYAEAGFECADIRPFIHDMADQFARADVVICRSGATTVAGIAAAGKAAIFIPFPFATDDPPPSSAASRAFLGLACLRV
jgi:UDP-N-acetylglucosamine--N-acetylmuramyl-(pentapeptide) pyrophosphoryl-undecaprenol N-acetylglucosamine transferase